MINILAFIIIGCAVDLNSRDKGHTQDLWDIQIVNGDRVLIQRSILELTELESAPLNHPGSGEEWEGISITARYMVYRIERGSGERELLWMVEHSISPPAVTIYPIGAFGRDDGVILVYWHRDAVFAEYLSSRVRGFSRLASDVEKVSVPPRLGGQGLIWKFDTVYHRTPEASFDQRTETLTIQIANKVVHRVRLQRQGEHRYDWGPIAK